MKRVIRNRRLTREEAAGYADIRKKISKELPDLIDRHHQRMAALDQLQDLLLQLKAAREAKGLSLSDLTELTGMDRSALFNSGGAQNDNLSGSRTYQFTNTLRWVVTRTLNLQSGVELSSDGTLC